MSKSFAPHDASRRLTASAAKAASTPLVIESVKRLTERADVWDITVPDGHWFALENGAVVHNSDAFGLLAVAYEEPRVRREAARRPVHSGGNAWMGR
jgi:hypothetical protein